MAFIFTCGTHMFDSLLPGYEHITVQCQRCGNYSAKVHKRWEWFTFCFVPIIPFSLKAKHDVYCDICHTPQGLEYRPDVQAMMESGQQGGAGGQSIPLQGAPQGSNQGWNSQQPPQQPPPMMHGAQQPPQKQGKQQPQYL